MKIIWTYGDYTIGGINLTTQKEIIAKVVEREQQLFHHNIIDLTVMRHGEVLLYADYAKVRFDDDGFSHLCIVVTDTGIFFGHQNTNLDDIEEQRKMLKNRLGIKQVYWYEIASQKLIASFDYKETV